MLRDIRLVLRRDLIMPLSSPAWIVLGAAQPILYLVLFGSLMNRVIASTPGFPPGASRAVLTPALVVQVALLTSSFAGFGLLADHRTSVLELLRVTSVSRIVLLLGKAFASALQAMLQAVLVVAMAYLFFGLGAALVGVLISLAIAGVAAVSLSSASYAIALHAGLVALAVLAVLTVWWSACTFQKEDA